MVEVLQAGVLSTIQDLGRPGYRTKGIGPGGVMDPFAARAANALLGNDEGAAILEMHFPAPRLRFDSPAQLALGGANHGAIAGEKPIAPWRTFTVEAGTQLWFALPKNAARAYLAIRGGWDVPEWLGSRSTHPIAHLGGFQGRALRRGDRIAHAPQLRSTHPLRWSVSPLAISEVYTRPAVSLLPGPEFDWLTEASQKELLAGTFEITSGSDRVGYRLRGPVLERRNAIEMLSSGVCKGTLQLLPSGQLILLMADHPVTGGYPRIATVIDADIPYVAQQAAPGKLRFQMTTWETARASALSMEHHLQQLASASALRMEAWQRST